MNEYYTRIKGLMETAGITVSEGSANDGEAYAYGAALAAVAALPSLAAARSGMDGEAAIDDIYFASLLGISAERFSAEALAEEISARLSHSYADYTADDAAHAFQLIGSGSMSLAGGILCFADIRPEDLAELGKFIAAFQYIGIPADYNGSGLTFDEWDSFNYSFEKYDTLQLPWTVLDHYRRTV